MGPSFFFRYRTDYFNQSAFKLFLVSFYNANKRHKMEEVKEWKSIDLMELCCISNCVLSSFSILSFLSVCWTQHQVTYGNKALVAGEFFFHHVIHTQHTTTQIHSHFRSPYTPAKLIPSPHKSTSKNAYPNRTKLYHLK